MTRPATRNLAVALAALALMVSAQRAGALEAGEELYARISALLAERCDEPVARIEVPPQGALADEAAARGVEVALSLAGERAKAGTNAVTVRLARRGVVFRRAVVNARVWVKRELVVAARPLRAGTTLAAGDVTHETRESASPRGDALIDPQLALGQRLTRHLGAGEPLRVAWLEAAPRVRRGDRVTLRFARGPLTIETLGRAEQDGALGEWIRVRNDASKREVRGRVSAGGVVHVGS